MFDFKLRAGRKSVDLCRGGTGLFLRIGFLFPRFERNRPTIKSSATKSVTADRD